MPKILFIEDDDVQVLMYRTEFKAHGLEMIATLLASEGLKLAESEKPDLILLDLVMEEMDGLEVLKRLKANAKTKNIPVVVLSNLAKKEKADEAKKLGALDFWIKAELTPQEIVDKSKEVLEQKL